MENIEYIIWNIDPVLLHIGSFGIRWYSLLFALGFVLGYIIMYKFFKKENIDIKLLDKLSVYMFVGTLLGARLGHCFFYDPSYYLVRPWEIILPFKGIPFSNDFKFTGFQGLASHGASIGLLIALFLFVRKYKLSLSFILDRVVIVTALAASFIRIGNLMNSEIIGKVTNVRWAFIFSSIDNTPRHPSQIYEALSYFIVFIVLIVLYKYEKFRNEKWLFFGLFLIGIFTSRFFIEFLKIQQEEFQNNFFLNMGQILSIPFVILGIYSLIKKNRYN